MDVNAAMKQNFVYRMLFRDIYNPLGKGPILNDTEAILIPKIYARLQEIASNFSKFCGGSPPDSPPALAFSALGSGLRPLTGPPFPKFVDSPLYMVSN